LINRTRIAWLLGALIASLGPQPAYSQNPTETPIVIAAEPARDTVQDIAELRRVVRESTFVPRAEMLSYEGLASGYDAALPVQIDCAAPLCLSAHAMVADIPALPRDRFLVGLAVAPGAQLASLPAVPLNLIFVIDRSGSMEHGRLDRVKAGLLAALDQLREGDRLALVEFDDDASVLVSMADVGVARERFSDAIQSLKPDGLTNLEAGLDLALRMAFAEQEIGAKNLHVVLVSDEHPDRDPAKAGGFMALMRGAGERAVGVSFVGVEQIFDSVLAMRLSAEASAKLYSSPPDGNLGTLFASEFPAMVTGTASGAALLLKPAEGLKISAIFGVAPELVSHAAGGGVLINLGSTFAAIDGQVFATLAPQHGGAPLHFEAPLLTAELRYRSNDGDYLVATANAVLSADAASAQLQFHHALADEYLTLAPALASYHEGQDLSGAQVRLAALRDRLDRLGMEMLQPELELVDAIAQRLEDRGAQQAISASGLVGRWEVRRQRGLTGAGKGDVVELTKGGELVIHRMGAADADATSRQTFQLGEGQLLVDGTDLVFDFHLKGDTLELVATRGGDRLKLKRAR